MNKKLNKNWPTYEEHQKLDLQEQRITHNIRSFEVNLKYETNDKKEYNFSVYGPNINRNTRSRGNLIDSLVYNRSERDCEKIINEVIDYMCLICNRGLRTERNDIIHQRIQTSKIINKLDYNVEVKVMLDFVYNYDGEPLYLKTMSLIE